MQLMTLARWLAHKAVKEEWRAQGTKVQYIEASEIAAAANLYLVQHMAELMKEAAIRHMVTAFPYIGVYARALSRFQRRCL